MKQYIKPTIFCEEIHTQQLMAVSPMVVDTDTETDTAYGNEFFIFDDQN